MDAKQIRGALGIVAGMIILIWLVGIKASQETRAPQPVMQWVGLPASTTALRPGGFTLGFTSIAGKQVRVDVTSVTPVTVAFVPAMYHGVLLAGSTTPATVLQRNGSPLDPQCAASSVIHQVITCSLPNVGSAQWDLIVVDERTSSAGSALMSAAGAYLGVRGPAEQMTAQNNVTIAFSDYRCTEHCRGY